VEGVEVSEFWFWRVEDGVEMVDERSDVKM